VFKTMQVAVPGKRYRITKVDGHWKRFLAVELWWPQDEVWLMCSHIPLPLSFTEQDIERVVNDAVEKYTSQFSQEVTT
jgi:hypothetical protein